MLRTHTCGELRKKYAGKRVVLCGWISSMRKHEKIIFVDLRDRYGITQIVFDPDKNEKAYKEISKLSKESVISVKGKIRKRPRGKENPRIDTGEIEVEAENVEVLNVAKKLPFSLEESVKEDVRLRYRYLDLRRQSMQKNLLLRHKIVKAIRDFFDSKGFVEIETPVLSKSTPEGARDYLVPSRIWKGKFYALPQSPQLLKQILMISGFDKYFQIVKCFRDEDLRADRQPEFTQIDIEMSFVEENDIMEISEKMIAYVFEKVMGEKIKTPFPRLDYNEVMQKYKTDKPDLRKGKEKYAFCWITNFPLFEWNEEEQRYVATHHPFTMPSDPKNFEKEPEKAKARSYDLVLNGIEIAGGSIRIYQRELQEKMFDVLKISKKEAREKFGFLLEALEFGAPPHGGIAFGLDRLIKVILNLDSIREVIAFPKNKAAQDLLTNAPSIVEKKQLDELGLKLEKKD